MKRTVSWGVKWRGELLGRLYFTYTASIPAPLLGYMAAAFETRAAARLAVKNSLGYLYKSSFLRSAPFKRGLPKVVKISIQIRELKK